MRMPMVFILLVALTTVPHFTFSQESPTDETTTEQEESQPNDSSEEISDTTEATTREETESQEKASDETRSDDNEDIPSEPTRQSLQDDTLEERIQETEPKVAQQEAPSEIPTQPEPVQEEKIVIPEQQEEKPVGIDTVSLDNPQGNWLFKKIWWERAEERYEKIRGLVDSIWNSRTDFFTKRNDLERNVLEPFYITVGMDKSELQGILADHTRLFEKQRTQDTEISSEERTLYDTIATEEEALKQLERDVETVVNLDHHIDNALQTLMEQINRVRDFEKQAWKNFKEIAHTLNDAKARELYYMVEGSARNIKNISVYLERDFTQYFNRLINDTGKIIVQIQNQIEAFKEKGIYLIRQSEESTKQETQQADEDEDEDTDTDAKPKQKAGWLDWIVSGTKNIFSSIFSIIRMPYDLIFGK